MDFIINGGNAGAKINVRQYNNNGIEYAELSVDLKEAAIPETLCISFKVPAVGCYSVWSPSARQSHSIEPEWRSQQTESSLAGYMPLHQLLSLDGKNRLCIAVSDAAVPISIKTGICEFDASVSCKIEFLPALPQNAADTVRLFGLIQEA